jgi:RNA polymerase sigma-70 factor, ECF subfamily
VVLDCLVISIAEARAPREFNNEFWNELWRSHASSLLRTTYRITRNREDAEDALQGALLNAFVHLQTFDGKSSLSTWLTRIAINSALGIVRNNRSRRQVPLDVSGHTDSQTELETFLDQGPDPEAQCAKRERGAILVHAIRGLRPKLRQALILHLTSLESLWAPNDYRG